MTPNFNRHLDQFKDLIAHVGPERLFAAPLVTPEDTWFPDAWSPDLECARRVLLRLAEYAGLPDLDVEVVLEYPTENRVPTPVKEQAAEHGRTGYFIGTHEGCAWFSIREDELQDPKHLVDRFMVEMALTWRQHHDLHATPIRAEYECAEVTAVFLGFGIFGCNAAFEAHPEGASRGARITWSRYSSLEVDDVSGLLACWAILKELPEAAIVKHLGPTQADGFRKAWAQWSGDDLRARLGIASASIPEVHVLEGASSREFKPSQAARNVHGTVERLVAMVGEDGGLAAEPIPFPVSAIAVPHRRLAVWGRLSAAGTWTRSITLVSDTEWDTQAVVLGARTGDELRRYALGHVRDHDARDPRHLQELFVRAFRSGSPFRSLLAPGLPTFVGTSVGSGNFNVNHLESSFRMLADEADPAEVTREADWLLQHKNRALRRLDFELEHGCIPDPPPTARRGSKHWWDVVSQPDHVHDESNDVRYYRAAARRHAAPANPASPPESSGSSRPDA
jgi:hypothetical protein